jgi:hypothetical protein
MRGGRTFEPGPGRIFASIGSFLPAQREMAGEGRVNSFQDRERRFLEMKSICPGLWASGTQQKRPGGAARRVRKSRKGEENAG